MRPQIISILSQTANGCLSELGYLPDTHRRLAQLASDNEKLFADNRTLAQTLAAREAFINYHRLPPDQRTVWLDRAAVQLTELAHERDTLARRVLAGIQPQPGDAPFQRLVAEHDALLAEHRAALEDLDAAKSQLLQYQRLFHTPLIAPVQTAPRVSQPAAESGKCGPP